MKKYLKLLLMALLVCGVMTPNVLVKAGELEGEEVSDGVNIVGETKSGDYWYNELGAGTVAIMGYVGSATDITIPSTLDGKTVTSIDDQAFMGCANLTSVTIPVGVTSIGNSAFYECANLTSVTIPVGVTSIGNSAFYGCASLTGVTIPVGVTSIGNSAFYKCASLTGVTIPVGVTSIGNSAFYKCASLTGVTIPVGVTSIGNNAFYGCASLTAVTIPASVTSIEFQAFNSCTNLVSVKLLSGLENIGNSAFEYCSKLDSIKIPNSVTSIGNNAFYNCKYDFIIYCSPTSYAATYAKNNYLRYAEKSVKELKITLSETTCIYDGNYKEPKVTVKDGNKTLKKGTDYYVDYHNNGAIGKATVTIEGTCNGGYGGIVTKTFTITKGDYYNSTIHGGTWKNGIYTLGGVKMTNIFFSDGKYTYYLQADGTAMKNRLTYHPDGIHLIYFDDKGHELFDQFQYCADVKYTCYFDTNGYLYKDVITFSNGKAYYLDGNGKMKQNEWFKFDNGVDLGYAQADGSLINTGFGYDPWGNTVFYHWNGMVARGLITDGVWYYDMDLTDGHLRGQFAVN